MRKEKRKPGRQVDKIYKEAGRKKEMKKEGGDEGRRRKEKGK